MEAPSRLVKRVAHDAVRLGKKIDGDVVLDTLNIGVTTVSAVADKVSVPGLKTAAEIAAQIVSIAQTVRKNKADAVKLGEQATEHVKSIELAYKGNSGSVGNDAFHENVEALNDTLREILAVVEELAGHGIIKRTVYHKSDERRIGDAKEKLDITFRRFNVVNGIIVTQDVRAARDDILDGQKDMKESITQVSNDVQESVAQVSNDVQEVSQQVNTAITKIDDSAAQTRGCLDSLKDGITQIGGKLQEWANHSAAEVSKLGTKVEAAVEEMRSMRNDFKELCGCYPVVSVGSSQSLKSLHVGGPILTPPYSIGITVTIGTRAGSSAVSSLIACDRCHKGLSVCNLEGYDSSFPSILSSSQWHQLHLVPKTQD
ncbi:hypothetical protein NM688_g749 [Phlebia brevispora]|uniref:Uncharacterized protein n=1 Tax=Phlebia brevispora TaxID=194682 RepID=A0ACC1TD49_9APHY|nr:hypothetical protein NM688_g749 [Phlebia brevispora]